MIHEFGFVIWGSRFGFTIWGFTIWGSRFGVQDLGLTIGHSTRSISESIAAARDDHTVLTSLLEMRYVAGDESLWTSLTGAIQQEIGKQKPLVFVEEKLAERDVRHKRFGAATGSKNCPV